MMRYVLRLSTVAAEDYEEAFSYYQAKSSELGSRFSEELLDLLERIESNPNQFQAEDYAYRRAHLKKFPYTIFYKMLEEEARIEIIAIWPQSARPGSWKKSR